MMGSGSVRRANRREWARSQGRVYVDPVDFMDSVPIADASPEQLRRNGISVEGRHE